MPLFREYQFVVITMLLKGRKRYATLIDFDCRACVSHYDVPKVEREKLGISDFTVRLSVGLENIVDLIADLDQALSLIPDLPKAFI